MKKRILSMLLFLIMLVCIMPVNAQTTDMAVYLTISKYGEIAQDKNGDMIACAKVELSGKSEYNLDDVFAIAHSMYFEEGADGYESSQSQWGFGIDKLWGDTSGNFGYQINGGTKMVSGLDTLVEDGDYIDACIYQNAYPDTEGYAMFDKNSIQVCTDTEFELTLKYFSGYDEEWNTIISPCSGATITVNGTETEFITDENGKAVITLDNEGRNIISAKKTRLLEEEEVPAITAPICVAITAAPEMQIIHNIAEQYCQMDYSVYDVNLPWIVADMMMYESLFPESEYILSDEQKSEAVNSIVDFVADAEKASDLAKGIIALSALGFDAENIFTKDLEKIDIVTRLTDMIKTQDSAVTNIYTVPYVIKALSQSGEYGAEEDLAYLISSVIENKESWQSTENGTDAMTPMLTAIAPYTEKYDTLSALIYETIDIIKSEQREDGLIDGFEGYEPASTGLALCAFSAAGIDSTLVKNGENSLISALIGTANQDLTAFPNAFATEQAFRGLLSWRQLIEESGKTMYDFSDFEKNEINLSDFEYCPVIFDVTPDSCIVSIEGVTAIYANYFDLAEGQYEYVAKATGYVAEKGKIEVSEQDEGTHNVKNVEISLSRKNDRDSGSISVSPKDESGQADTQVPEKTEQSTTETIVFDDNTFPDVCSGDWYYPAVKYVYQNNLFKGTDSGFEPQSQMTRAMLVTVLHRYDDNPQFSVIKGFDDVGADMWYAQSVGWAAENGIVNGYSDNSFAPDESITREQLAVILYRYAQYKGYDLTVKSNADISGYKDADSISDYARDAIYYAVSSGVISGKTEDTIAPGESATRAEVATMIMRFAEVNKQPYEQK